MHKISKNLKWINCFLVREKFLKNKIRITNFEHDLLIERKFILEILKVVTTNFQA